MWMQGGIRKVYCLQYGRNQPGKEQKENDAEIAEILCDHGSNLQECIREVYYLQNNADHLINSDCSLQNWEIAG